MLAKGFGKNVQEGGFPINGLGGVQLWQSTTSEETALRGAWALLSSPTHRALLFHPAHATFTCVAMPSHTA